MGATALGTTKSDAIKNTTYHFAHTYLISTTSTIINSTFLTNANTSVSYSDLSLNVVIIWATLYLRLAKNFFPGLVHSTTE